MTSFLHTYRTPVLIFLLSLGAGLLACIALLAITSLRGLELVTLTGDAKGYMVLAENLVEHRVFSLSESEPYAPESFRAPGYPFFLAMVYAVFHNWVVVLLLQVAIVSVAPVLLYLLFAPYFERAAFWGAVVFALEPTRLFLSSMLLSDALFTSLFLGSLVVLEWGRRRSSLSYIALAGAILGLCILVRPIALFLPVLYAAYLIFFIPQRKRSIIAAVVGCLAALVIISPWMVRNHLLFGSWNISSVGAANLVLYNAPEFLTYAPDDGAEMVLTAFNEEQNSLPRHEALSLAQSSVFTSTFREVIAGRELSYIFFHMVKTIPFFVTDGLREIARLLRFEIGTLPNISGALLAGDSRLVAAYLAQGNLAVVLLLVGSGFWSVVSILCGWKLLQALYRRGPAFIFFCATLVLYFALLTGPVSNARYRLPVEGILLAVAASVLRREVS